MSIFTPYDSDAIKHILRAYLEQERQRYEKCYEVENADKINVRYLLPHLYRELRVLQQSLN